MSAWKILEVMIREDDDEDLLNRISGVKAPAPYSDKPAPSGPSRMDLIKQRSAATQGGKVQLKKGELAKNWMKNPAIVGHWVSSVLADAGPEGLSWKQVMAKLSDELAPGEAFNQQRVNTFVTNFGKKGISIKQLLDATGEKVSDGRWKAKGA